MLLLFGLQLGQFQLALSHNLPLNLHFLNDTASYLICLLTIIVSYSSMAVKIVYGAQSHHRTVTNRRRKLNKTLFMVTLVSLLLTFFSPRKIFSSDKDDSSDGDDYLAILGYSLYLDILDQPKQITGKNSFKRQ